MTWYNNLTHPEPFFLDVIYTAFHRTLALDQIVNFSPSIYWHIGVFKFDATCSTNFVNYIWWWPPLSVLRLTSWWYLSSSVIYSQWEKHNISVVSFPHRIWSLFYSISSPLSWAYSLIVYPWRIHQIWLILNQLPIKLTAYIVHFLIYMPLQHIFSPLQLHKIHH